MKDAHGSDLSLYTEDELRFRLEELSRGPRDMAHAMTYECQWEDCPWNDPDAVEGELIVREQERAR